MLESSDAERAIWILQDQCPGCGSDLLLGIINHCRNFQCPEAHASLRRTIRSSTTLQDLELQELSKGRDLYETLSILWFDNYER